MHQDFEGIGFKSEMEMSISDITIILLIVLDKVLRQQKTLYYAEVIQ
jgi:hypothetical protein